MAPIHKATRIAPIRSHRVTWVVSAGCDVFCSTALDEKQRSALHGKQWSSRDTSWAMSQENIDLALRAIEEFNDTRRLGPAFDRLIHPGVDFKDEIGAYDSRQEVRDFLEGFAESIGGLHVKIEDTMEA